MVCIKFLVNLFYFLKELNTEIALNLSNAFGRIVILFIYFEFMGYTQLC